MLTMFIKVKIFLFASNAISDNLMMDGDSKSQGAWVLGTQYSSIN
jgi:hypothetical protein